MSYLFICLIYLSYTFIYLFLFIYLLFSAFRHPPSASAVRFLILQTSTPASLHFNQAGHSGCVQSVKGSGNSTFLQKDQLCYSRCKVLCTSLLWEKKSVRIVLVLEYCKDNLRSYISKNHELIPAKSATKRKAIGTACQWMKEITDALAYTHDVQRIVHRDLKLENILVR